MYTQQKRKERRASNVKLLAMAGAFTVIGLGTNAVIQADEVDQAPIPVEETEKVSSDTTETTKTQDAEIPASVDTVTQEQAVSTINDAQEKLAEEVDAAKKSDVVVC